MTGIEVGDKTWETGNPYREIDIYIRDKPLKSKESLEVWVESMGEYPEMDMRSFQFSPGQSFFRTWAPDSIFNYLFRKRGEQFVGQRQKLLFEMESELTEELFQKLSGEPLNRFPPQGFIEQRGVITCRNAPCLKLSVRQRKRSFFPSNALTGQMTFFFAPTSER